MEGMLKDSAVSLVSLSVLFAILGTWFNSCIWIWGSNESVYSTFFSFKQAFVCIIDKFRLPSGQYLVRSQ